MNNMIFDWLLAVEWAGNYDNYNEATAGVIGASLLGLGQGVKLLPVEKIPNHQKRPNSYRSKIIMTEPIAFAFS